jgi:hypothetical protein
MARKRALQWVSMACMMVAAQAMTKASQKAKRVSKEQPLLESKKDLTRPEMADSTDRWLDPQMEPQRAPQRETLTTTCLESLMVRRSV